MNKTSGAAPPRHHDRLLAWAPAADALSAAGLRWCVLRDDSTEGGDVDLLVAADDLTAAVAAIEASGFTRLRTWGRRPHRFFVGCDARGATVKLDVVDRLSFGPQHELTTMLAPLVLRRVEERAGLPWPAPVDRQWLTLLHAVLDRGDIAPRHIRAMTPWDRAAIGVAARLPAGLRADVAAAVEEGSFTRIVERAPQLAAAIDRGEWATPLRARWRQAMKRTVKLQRALLRPGVSVALLGPDGAGKSTAIDGLLSQLAGTHHEYLGAYQRHRRRLPVPGLASLDPLVRLGGRGLRAGFHRRRGRDVVFDRHPLELRQPRPGDGWPQRIRRAVLSRAVRRPDVLVVLDAPPPVLHERKPEHTVAEATVMRTRYLDLAQRHGGIVVDTTAGAPAVVCEIRRHLDRARVGAAIR